MCRYWVWRLIFPIEFKPLVLESSSQGRQKRYMMTRILFIYFLAFVFACSFPQKLRKTEWSVAEMKDWTAENKNYSTWKGLLLYQGSDAIQHHFISRIFDEWIWFKIKRGELKIQEERVFSNTSSSSLGYYYVDPLDNFRKIRDY